MQLSSVYYRVPIVCGIVLAAGGSQCIRRDVNNYYSYGPRVLTQTPTGTDIMQAVNRNTALIRSLYTTDASLDAAGAPSLRANIAMERPRRLRLRAETALTGAELDLGSNDERFWFWLRRNQPPTLYHCRHDQFAASSARQLLPVNPEWLLDAVGMVTFDPAGQHSAPQKTRAGDWEIRSTVNGPTGPMSKTTVVDEAHGFVLEQHLYDERNTLIASALTSKHWRDPGSGAVVPQQIDINWPSTKFSLRLDVRKWVVNSIPADPTQLFTMPTYPGWAVVDLADPSLRMPAATGQIAPLPTYTSGVAPATSQGAAASTAMVPVPWNGQPAAAAVPPAANNGDLLGYLPPTSPYRAGASSQPGIGVSAGPWSHPAAGQPPMQPMPGMSRY